MQRRVQPPLDIEEDPTTTRVALHCAQHEPMVQRVEEGADVEVEDPVVSPTPLPRAPNGVKGRAPLTIPVGVRMELWLNNRIQNHLHHVLGDTVSNRRYTQSSLTPITLGNRHQFDRWREV